MGTGDSFTGNAESAFNKDTNFEIVHRVDFNYLNDWREDDIPSLELCFEIISDQSITKKGFNVMTKIEYENPEIIKWQKTECHIEKPSWRNPSRYDGSCGIGIQSQTITECNTALLNVPHSLDESGLYRGICSVGESNKR